MSTSSTIKARLLNYNIRTGASRSTYFFFLATHLFSSSPIATSSAFASSSTIPSAFLARTISSIGIPSSSHRHFQSATTATNIPILSSHFQYPSQASKSVHKNYFRSTTLKMTRDNKTNIVNNPPKRAKLTPHPPSTKTIGTHSGTFQADEALGVWLLRQIPLYRHSPVVRSRDPSVLQTCDIVLDVGGIYNHEDLKYDHHQRDYDERFDPKIKYDESNQVIQVERCTKLSASGLIYRHYGKEVIRQYYPELTQDMVDLAYVKMYDSFMEAVDAIDTGVEPIPPRENESPIQLQYVDKTGLSSRVSRLNPRWNEIDETTEKSPDPDARFEVASEMCGQDFLGMLTHIVESDLPARSFVDEAVKSRFEIDSSGEIICLPTGGLPWKGHLYDLEHEYNITDPLIKYLLYTDQAGMWRIQAVSVEGKGFENRLSLPKEWRGVRDEDLEKVAGIEGCTFCHASGFIGGNKSFEGALEMARRALENGKKI
mmetsp:Transcript_30202/g.63273  ORF Transcript_30202/g.63273 Transcript_30202/m.63273 type:complete len:485 (-) Transcript_30202:46-1500(-)